MQENKRTIDPVVTHGLCTGCGTCAGVCPVAAIEMIADSKRGLYVPRIEREQCITCGLCYDICPGHSVDFDALCRTVFGEVPTDARLGNYLTCQMGHALNEDIRYNSASGGLVTAILILALEQGLIDGALVTRMSSDRPLQAEPFIARTPDEIISASKSKYCPVPANTALTEIRESPGRYAVVGLPCHIQGVRKAESRDSSLRDKIVVHIGIACSMNWRLEAIDRLLESLSIRPEQVQKLDYRGQGWPGMMTILLNDSSTRSIPLAQFYAKLTPFPIKRCTLCSDHLGDLADLSFGDAWIPEIIKTDHVGTSFVISRTDSGREFLDKAVTAGRIQLQDLDTNRMLESQGNTLFKKKKLRARMAVVKLSGAKVPTYNQKSLPPSIGDYPEALKYYVIRYILSRRSPIVLRLFKTAQSLKKKVKAPFTRS